MPSVALDVKQFDGLLPLIDPRRAGKPFVLEGHNFLMTADGPASAFGSEYISYKKFYNPEEVATFRIVDNIFIFTQSGIFTFDTVQGVYVPQFVFSVTSEIWPWYYAICGNSYYFCRKGVGVIRYNTIAATWELTTNAYYPNDPVSICAANGRLVVLGTDRYAWSVQDDGTDFTPSLITGAGYQLTSLIGGISYRVDADNTGFFCCTSKGIIKATFTGSANVYRHTVLTDGVRIFSPFAACSLTDNTTILLTLNGFYITSGEKPTAWQQTMGEYFKTKVLPQLDLSIKNIIRIDYSQDAQQVFVSVGNSSLPNHYYQTYVYYAPSDQWSSFDRVHQGFGELQISDGANKGINFGYVNEAGYLSRFKELNHVEIADTSGATDELFWRQEITFDARVENSEHIMPCVSRSHSRDPISWKGLTTGRYELVGVPYQSVRRLSATDDAYYEGTTLIASSYLISNSVLRYWVATPYSQNLEGLNSYVTVGLLKFAEQLHADETSMIENLIVHGQPASPLAEIDDWTNDYPSDVYEDWNTISDVFEDWGFGVTAQSNYTASYIQSMDGRNLIPTGEEDLTLYGDEGGARIYVPNGFSSIFHAVKIAANEIGETFQLKLLSIGGMLTGRYEG